MHPRAGMKSLGRLVPIKGNGVYLSSSTTRVHRRKISHRVLVVGSGAIGLRTAWEILQRNDNDSRTQDAAASSKVEVIVQSPCHPLDPSTCSMGAGGLWMPFHVSDARVNRWALETLDELYPLAIDKSCDLAEIVPAVSFFRDHRGYDALKEYDQTKRGDDDGVPPAWTKDRRLEFQHLTVEMLAWQNTVLKLRIPPEDEVINAGYKYAWLFKTPIVECVKMLQHYIKLVSSHPQALSVDLQSGRKYSNMEEMCNEAVSLGCDAVINCTGLGATQICNDHQMVGVRGILHHYNRHNAFRRSNVLRCNKYGQQNEYDAVILAEEPPWGNQTEPCYMIPRGDLIVVGGSCLDHDTEKSIRHHERNRLNQNAHILGLDINRAEKVGEWTGFRPYRLQSVRCEMDNELSTDSLKVIHSYGYGGSGWTVNVGAAKQVADILMGPRG